jgi:hypothetical protein
VYTTIRLRPQAGMAVWGPAMMYACHLTTSVYLVCSVTINSDVAMLRWWCLNAKFWNNCTSTLHHIATSHWLLHWCVQNVGHIECVYVGTGPPSRLVSSSSVRRALRLPFTHPYRRRTLSTYCMLSNVGLVKSLATVKCQVFTIDRHTDVLSGCLWRTFFFMTV